MAGHKRQRGDDDESSDDDSFQFETENPFSKEWQNSDVVLMVEEQEIHTHSNLLGFASPVFQRMFEGKFKEGKTKSVEMKGKSYEAVVNVVKLIYPQMIVEFESLSIETLSLICGMVEEYMMDAIFKKIEMLLVLNLEKMLDLRMRGDEGYYRKKYPVEDMLKLADKHNFHSLLSDCASRITSYPACLRDDSVSDKAKTKCFVNIAIKHLDSMERKHEDYENMESYKKFIGSSIKSIRNAIEPIKKRAFLSDTKRIES